MTGRASTATPSACLTMRGSEWMQGHSSLCWTRRRLKGYEGCLGGGACRSSTACQPWTGVGWLCEQVWAGCVDRWGLVGGALLCVHHQWCVWSQSACADLAMGRGGFRWIRWIAGKVDDKRKRKQCCAPLASETRAQYAKTYLVQRPIAVG